MESKLVGNLVTRRQILDPVLRLCLCVVVVFIYSEHLHPFFIIEISLTVSKRAFQKPVDLCKQTQLERDQPGAASTTTIGDTYFRLAHPIACLAQPLLNFIAPDHPRVGFVERRECFKQLRLGVKLEQMLAHHSQEHSKVDPAIARVFSGSHWRRLRAMLPWARREQLFHHLRGRHDSCMGGWVVSEVCSRGACRLAS